MRETIVDEVVTGMATIYVRLQELNMPVWLRLDLTMAQLRALVVVSQHPGITVGGLGCELSIGQSAGSLLVDHLVRRGLVDRSEDPEDRRRSLLSCTADGEALLRELRHGNRQVLKEWLAKLTGEELEGMARGLRRVSETARATSQRGSTGDEAAS